MNGTIIVNPLIIYHINFSITNTINVMSNNNYSYQINQRFLPGAIGHRQKNECRYFKGLTSIFASFEFHQLWVFCSLLSNIFIDDFNVR